MEVLESQIDSNAPQFKANAVHNRRLTEELREHVKIARQGGARSIKSGSTSRASYLCAIGSISCSIGIRRFWNCRRWPHTICITTKRRARAL